MVLKDKLIRNFYHIVSLRSAHTRELVLATSRGNKSHRVNSPFLLESLVVRPKILSLRLAPRNKTGLNFLKFLRLVPQNASCELFVGQVPATKLEQANHKSLSQATSPCYQSVRVNSLGDYLQGLVPSCVPTSVIVVPPHHNNKVIFFSSITTYINKIPPDQLDSSFF